MTAVLVPLSTSLITRINRREGDIKAAGKSMLMLAKEQGEDLIRLKQVTPHGEFKIKVQQETSISYSTAAAYMKVASHWEKFSTLNFLPSLRAALAEIDGGARRPTFTRDDAEYVLKINALATRGATEGERDAAEAKLDNLAQQHGTDAGNLVKKAENLCPNQQQSACGAALQDEVMASYRQMSKTELLEVVWTLLSKLADAQ